MSDDKQNRNTRQKSMILEYLKDRQDTHVRAEDIIHDLNAGEERGWQDNRIQSSEVFGDRGEDS